MSENNNDADIVTITTTPVQFQSQYQQSTDQQNKAVSLKGDAAQQDAIREMNNQTTQTPITEQPQTASPGITLTGTQPQGGAANGGDLPVIPAPQPQQEQSAPPPATNSENINVEQFNSEVDETIGEQEAERRERAEKRALLNRALKSLDKKAPEQKINVITNEVVAEYIVYLPDNTGKTVYDYMKDPFVAQHIEFQFPEGAKEGDNLKAAITPVWIDPNY